MINVSKFVDRILSNVCLINTAGLYDGKAGISLALFEASGYLKDEGVENEAFKLFQEALILKTQDLSFEYGLSGIGYVLCYLIENKFMEADFDEIFGDQYEKIVKNLGDIEKKPERLLNVMQVIYFLSMVKKVDKRATTIIRKIFEGLELFLTVQFFDFMDIHYINDKMAVLRIYEIYLQLVNHADYKYFSRSLLNDYADLYRKGRLVSSIATGHNLWILLRKNKITEYDDVVANNLMYGIRNIKMDMFSLREKIDVMKLLSDTEKNGIVQPTDMKMDDLLKSVNANFAPLGYKEGLARLLLFCVNRQTELL
jgi:hypothetical protein